MDQSGPTERDYASAGVNIAANEEVVQRIQASLRRTQDRRVISNPNGFAGLFRLMTESRSYEDPVLVGCSDGVGSKLLLACKLDRLESIGIDLVAMNVNDLITTGATPLFFLDYVALHRNEPQTVATLVAGIATGCVQAGCALLGGETAEMRDLYRQGEFDLAGFAVGVVERAELISGQAVKPGNTLIGLASSGVHSNGYTLIRRLLEVAGPGVLDQPRGALQCTVGEELLRPTRIYVKPILSLLSKRPTVIKGMAHITGGGLPGNVPRQLPAGAEACMRKGSWPVPEIFSIIQSLGVAEEEMFRVFNMGIGMVLVVQAEDAQPVVQHFEQQGLAAWNIGHINAGESGMCFID